MKILKEIILSFKHTKLLILIFFILSIILNYLTTYIPVVIQYFIDILLNQNVSNNIIENFINLFTTPSHNQKFFILSKFLYSKVKTITLFSILYLSSSF